jgi:sugar transferase (PEP-CTERM/EpsH1 system associated)
MPSQERTEPRPPLLLLCHRIPYPPDKGDKIRSFHLLRELAQHFEVFLATFVDDPDDWKHCSSVSRYCAATHFRPLRPLPGRILSLPALLSGSALSRQYYRDRLMQRWVEKTVREHGISRALAVSSPMAQYLLSDGMKDALDNLIVDFVDLDSQKWAAYGQESRWPLSWLYRREATALFAWERRVVASASRTLFVSKSEQKLFERLTDWQDGRVDHIPNGVDADFFCPALEFPSPFDNNDINLVFTGAMDYPPNVGAVRWFTEQVMPRLVCPEYVVRFWIVGGRPSSSVRALAQQNGVHVTGRVADVRPYLKHAHAVVAPMRIARGIQNKVLEAMAMARPTLVSPEALEGIPARDGEEVILSQTPEDYVRGITAVRNGMHPGLGGRARGLVLNQFSWSSNVAPLVEALA